MDQGTFEQQSRDDQLAYGAFLREVYQEDAAAVKVSRTSTGAEIIDDERLKEATARGSVQPDGAAAATPAEPGSNYTKMAPSRVSPAFPHGVRRGFRAVRAGPGGCPGRALRPAGHTSCE